MNARDFREAIKPFAQQYMASLLANNPNSDIAAAAKRQSTIALREVAAPLIRTAYENQVREREVYQ